MSYIRVLSKRDKNVELPEDLLVIDIDRTNPLLGNPFPMKNKDDDEERTRVIQQFEEHFNRQMSIDGLVRKLIMDLVQTYVSGKPIGLRCWCHPKPCHGDVIKNTIERLGKEAMALTKLPPSPELEKIIKDEKPVVQEKPFYLQQRWTPEEIDYIECRFAVYVPEVKGREEDWHMVKEVVHLKNGEVHPNVRWYRNWQALAYVTHKNHRTYKQKKETEHLDRLITVRSPRFRQNFEVARALGDFGLASRPHLIKDSPWVYGMDVPTVVDIKYKYQERMKGKKETPYSIAYSDTETDMNQLMSNHPGKKKIIMQSIFFNGELYTYVVSKFVAGIYQPEKELWEKYHQYMPEQGKEIVKKWEFEFVKTPMDIIKKIIEKAHQLQPDFLSFWNMIFDWDKMVEMIADDYMERTGNWDPKQWEIDNAVAEAFCDPRLPPHMKHYNIKRANPSMTTASGRTKSKKPAEQWHSIHIPMPFYVIDQMATYRFVRKSKQSDKEGSSLDFILAKELSGLSKLKFKEAEGLTKAEFHIFLQKNYPLEYIIYHIWDAVCMELLTKATKDLDYSMPGSTGISDFQSYESEPKRYVHDFHYFALKHHNQVTGVSGKTLTQEYDQYTISTKGHIITLEPHLTLDNGLCIFKDYPFLRTYLRGHAGDLDVKGSYPYGQWVFNMSRATTVRELIEIEGVRDHDRRIQGLNISGGPSNALEFCTIIFNMPSLADLSRIYDEEMAAKQD